MPQIVFELLSFSKAFSSLTIAEVWEEAAGFGLSPQNSFLTSKGKVVQSNSAEPISNEATVRVLPRLRGGKGGFGSMLRAIGAQIEKTTNREACRDLSGRRLKDINEEKRLREWLEKQKEEPEDPSEKFKRKISKLLAKPKHEFKDEAYLKQMSDMTEKVDEAVEQGFKKYVENEEIERRGVKRALRDERGNIKKPKGAVFTGLEDASSGSDSDTDDSDSDTDFDDETMRNILQLYLKDREQELEKGETHAQDRSEPASESTTIQEQK